MSCREVDVVVRVFSYSARMSGLMMYFAFSSNLMTPLSLYSRGKKLLFPVFLFNLCHRSHFSPSAPRRVMVICHTLLYACGRSSGTLSTLEWTMAA